MDGSKSFLQFKIKGAISSNIHKIRSKHSLKTQNPIYTQEVGIEIPHPTTNKKAVVLKCNKNNQRPLKMTEMEVKKNHVYTVTPSVEASMPSAKL